MRTHFAMGTVCAGVALTLALSGCTNGSERPDGLPTPVTASLAPSATVTDPSATSDPSLPAGIPTADPSPASGDGPSTLNASAVITLATIDPDSGGLLVGGFVSGVAEDGGDCQYIVVAAAGDSLTVHTDGVENNGSTSCGSTTIAPSLVPAGSYDVKLRYVGAAGEGATESAIVKVDLP